MKKLLALTLALLIPFCYSGCSAFRVKSGEGEVDVEKIVRYIEPASYFACKTLLKEAVDEGDRAEKAKTVFLVAKTVRILSDGTLPTQDELEEAVTEVVPNKVHWVEFATELGIVYERFFESVNESDRTALIFEALGELAEGCERAAKPYVTVQEYENYMENHVRPFEVDRALMRPIAYGIMGVNKRKVKD